jgi:hypothetical protein
MYPNVVELAKDVPFGQEQGDLESLLHGVLRPDARTVDTSARAPTTEPNLMNIFPSEDREKAR